MNEVKQTHKRYLTVGDLLKFINDNNIPMDAAVLYERIEDHYFEKNNWTSIKRKGYWWHYLQQHNEDIDSGKYLDKEQYPNIKPEHLVKSDEKDMENSKDEFIVADNVTSFPDDRNLYITAHY